MGGREQIQPTMGLNLIIRLRFKIAAFLITDDGASIPLVASEKDAEESSELNAGHVESTWMLTHDRWIKIYDCECLRRVVF